MSIEHLTEKIEQLSQLTSTTRFQLHHHGQCSGVVLLRDGIVASPKLSPADMELFLSGLMAGADPATVGVETMTYEDLREIICNLKDEVIALHKKLKQARLND